MESEWMRFLRENRPDLYEDMRSDLQHLTDWRDKIIQKYKKQYGELNQEVVENRSRKPNDDKAEFNWVWHWHWQG